MEEQSAKLSKYRYEISLEAICDAKIMFDNGRYKNALNRAYYSIFHSIRAVNALHGYDSSKHSGVIAYFNQSYVKEGIFPKELSKIIKLAYENREKADYLDFYIASKEEAVKQIARAEKFIEYIKKYLTDVGVLCNEGFSVTQIPMKKICDNGYPVSRSQAKRLYFGFDKFNTVILDFKDVEDIGQGFAHELFVVFKRKNPNIELKAINANEDVLKMINHVLVS